MSQSARNRVQKGPKKHGMGSISDMFKKQNESKGKKKGSFNHKLMPKLDLKAEIEKLDDSDAEDDEVEIIAVEQPESAKQSQQLHLSNKSELVVENKAKDRHSISELLKPRSRLSLKRKSNSECDNRIEKSLTKDGNLEPQYSDEIERLDESTKTVHANDSYSVKFEEDIEGREIVEKSEPYYQKNFEAILKSIIGDKDVLALFNDNDNSAIHSYLSLSEQSRQLYVRLFGRKYKWIPMSKIKYPAIGGSLEPFLEELTNSQLIHNEESLNDLRDVLEMLSAGNIKALAKLHHVSPSVTQKKQIIEELFKLCHRNTVSSMFGSKGGLTASMLKKSKAMVDGAYKLQQEPRSVFIRVMMLFSLVNTTGDEENGNGGQGQLFQMLMVNMGKVVYPSYEIDKTHQVFQTREDVIRFEHALQLESDLLHAVEKGNWTGAYDIYCKISKQLEELQQDLEIARWNKSLPEFLRCFTATSVLYRLMSQGIDILQRRKEYTEAVALIKLLLDQQVYCVTHRGYWWERLALNLDVHLKKPLESLEAVACGLGDDDVIGGHRLALFQRAEAICERARLKLKHRLSEIHHNSIRELPKVYLEGRILHQGVTSSGPRFLTEGSYSKGNAQDMTVCGVEEFVMEHYRNNGYPSGLHAEGSIVTSLFGLFFWDIIFMAVPDAFHSRYQAQPLDLYTSTSFYSSRKDELDDRLDQLEKASCVSLDKILEETWEKEHGKVCAGMNWDRFNSVDDAKGLVRCMGGKALSGLLCRYAKCPRHTRSGFPDLTLWNVNTGAWKICEVKGPGDKLSHKQILWLDYLLSLGVDAEVCHVKAVAAKKLRPST